jgi:enoyl-CoA hydratase
MRSAISPATWTFDQFALASFSEDHKEGVAALLGRRKPRFRGR